jgi:chemotaxis protein CheZ
MTARRTPYRIELVHDDKLTKAPAVAEAAGTASDARLDEALSLLREMKTFLHPSQRLASDVIEAYRREIAEVYKLRHELGQMKDAIDGTRTEIAAIRRSESEGNGVRRVHDELDAVVADTEQATTRILSATEEVETQVSYLRSVLAGRAEAERLDVIVDQVVSLYEACNFQDLTGQRITKVVKALQFLEQRLNRIMGAWSSIDAFRDAIAAMQPSPADGEAKPGDMAPLKSKILSLINGPRLPEDEGHVSQAEIDSLFD